MYVWVMVLSKAIRVLFDPHHKDHWDDIIGYATLALRLVEKGSSDGSTDVSQALPEPTQSTSDK
jgi:hypothetical protein